MNTIKINSKHEFKNTDGNLSELIVKEFYYSFKDQSTIVEFINSKDSSYNQMMTLEDFVRELNSNKALREFEEKFKTDRKVKYLEEFDVYPHDIIQKNETGTIVDLEAGVLTIKLDKHHEELNEWDNCHIIDVDNDGIETILKSITL